MLLCNQRCVISISDFVDASSAKHDIWYSIKLYASRDCLSLEFEEIVEPCLTILIPNTKPFRVTILCHLCSLLPRVSRITWITYAGILISLIFSASGQHRRRYFQISLHMCYKVDVFSSPPEDFPVAS